MKTTIMRIHFFSLAFMLLFSTHSFAGKKTVVKTRTVTECDEFGENCEVVVDTKTCRGANCASQSNVLETVDELVKISFPKVDPICPKGLSANSTVYRLPFSVNTCLQNVLVRKLSGLGFSVDTDSFTDFVYKEHSFLKNASSASIGSGDNDDKDRGSDRLQAEVLIRADGKEILADTQLQIDFDNLFFQFGNEEIQSDSMGNVTSRTPLEDFILIPSGAVFEIYSLPRDFTVSGSALSEYKDIPISMKSIGIAPISIEDSEIAACAVGKGIDKLVVNIPYYGDVNGFKVIPQIDRLEEDTNCFERSMPIIMLPSPALPTPALPNPPTEKK